MVPDQIQDQVWDRMSDQVSGQLLFQVSDQVPEVVFLVTNQVYAQTDSAYFPPGKQTMKRKRYELSCDGPLRSQIANRATLHTGVLIWAHGHTTVTWPVSDCVRVAVAGHLQCIRSQQGGYTYFPPRKQNHAKDDLKHAIQSTSKSGTDPTSRSGT